MKTDGKPKSSRAPQRNTKEQADERRQQHPGPVLTSIRQVQESKNAREHYRRRPESDASCQGEQRIPAQQEIFEQPHQYEIHQPKCGQAKQPPSVKDDVTRVEGSALVQDQKEQADGQEPPQRTRPEPASKGLFHRQSVCPPGAPLHSGQDQRGNDSRQKISGFLQQHRPKTPSAQILSGRQARNQRLQREKSDPIKGQAPTGPKAVRAPKQSVDVGGCGGHSKDRVDRSRGSGICFSVASKMAHK